MFLASIAHILAFPITPYKVEDQRLNWLSNIANAANPSDLSFEIKSHYTHLYVKIKSKLRKTDSKNLAINQMDDDEPDENTKLLSDEKG